MWAKSQPQQRNPALLLCYKSKYLGVTLNRSLTYRRHLESLTKKLTSRVALLRQFVGSGWGAGATTLRTSNLALVHSTAEYCAPVWCCSAYTCPIDRSTKPCELWLDACVLQLQATFLSSRASNFMSFVAVEPHCLLHAMQWSLDMFSTQRLPVQPVGMHGISNRDTHLYPLHNNSSVHLTTATD